MKEKIEERINDLLDAKSVIRFTEAGLQTFPLPCNMTEEQVVSSFPGAMIVQDRTAVDKGIQQGIKVTGMDKTQGENPFRQLFLGLLKE